MKRLLPWMFVPLALAGGALGWWAPEAFAPARAWISTALGVVMFTMGLATSWDDVREIRGRWVLVGIALQYLVMPLGAAGIAAMLGLPPALALGVVLV
ncbi:MAG: bile acid:sodium symporter, partial [Zetaproteobacteria bacterium]